MQLIIEDTKLKLTEYIDKDKNIQYINSKMYTNRACNTPFSYNS